MTNKQSLQPVPKSFAEIAENPKELWVNQGAIEWLKSSKFPGLSEAQFQQVIALGLARGLNPFKDDLYAYSVQGRGGQPRLVTVVSYYWFLKKIKSHKGYQGHKADVVLKGDKYRTVNGVVHHESVGFRDQNQPIVGAWAYIKINGIEYYHTLDARDYWPNGVPGNSYGAVKDTSPGFMIKKAVLCQLARQVMPEDTSGLLSDSESVTIDLNQKSIEVKPGSDIIDVEVEDETEDLTPLVNELKAIIKVQFKDDLVEAKTYLSRIVGKGEFRKLRECTKQELETIKAALLERQAKIDEEKKTPPPGYDRKAMIVHLNEFFNDHFFGDIDKVLDFYEKQGIKDPDNLTDDDIELLETAKAHIEDYRQEKEENENPTG